MFAQSQVLAFLNSIGVPEMIVIGVIALLIFGRRLPEVGRSLGKSFVEFKKGLKDTGDDIDQIKEEANRTIRENKSTDRPVHFNDPNKSSADSKAAH